MIVSCQAACDVLHQCIKVVCGDNVTDVIPCVLDSELPIVCLKYNKGLHYDPIVVGCLEDDVSDYEHPSGAADGGSEPGDPEDAPEGSDASACLKAQEESEGESPHKLLVVDPPGGILKRPAGVLKRPAAIEFGEGSIVTSQLVKDTYTIRSFKREFKGVRRSHSESMSDAEKGHLMYAKLAVMISEHGWWNGRASRCADELADMHVNRNKLGLVCSQSEMFSAHILGVSVVEVNNTKLALCEIEPHPRAKLVRMGKAKSVMLSVLIWFR